MQLLQLKGKDNLSQRLVNDEKSVLHYYDLFREIMQKNISRPLHFEGNAPVSDIKWRTELDGDVVYPAPADFFEGEILPRIDQYEQKFAAKYKQEKGDEVYEERTDVYTSCPKFPRDKAHYAKIGVDWVLIGWGLSEGPHVGDPLVPKGISDRPAGPKKKSSDDEDQPGNVPPSPAPPSGQGNDEPEPDPDPLPPPPGPEPGPGVEKGGEGKEPWYRKWVFPWKKVLIGLLLLILLIWLIRSCTGPEGFSSAGSTSGSVTTNEGSGAGAGVVTEGSGQRSSDGNRRVAGESGQSSKPANLENSSAQSGQRPSGGPATRAGQQPDSGPQRASATGSGAPLGGIQEAIPGYDPRLDAQDRISPPAVSIERVVAEIIQLCDDEQCSRPRCVIRVIGSDVTYPCPADYNN